MKKDNLDQRGGGDLKQLFYFLFAEIAVIKIMDFNRTAQDATVGSIRVNMDRG